MGHMLGHMNSPISRPHSQAPGHRASSPEIWSRRSFLKAAGLGAAGLSLQSGIAAEKPIQGFERAPEDPNASAGWQAVSDRKIRVGIVGYGVCKFGAEFGFQNHPNVEVVAVSDLIPERCAELAKVCRCATTYGSLEELVKNDKIDSQKIAGLLRGGMFPMAYVYPPEMRATRDLLRRRCFLVRRRADLLGHVHSTAIQYNLPEIGVRLTYEGPRSTVPDHFPDPDVKKIVQIDLAMIDAYDDVIGALEWELEKTSRRQDRRTLMLLSSIHGVGRILSMVLLYEIHDINRFETVQDFASYCRLVKCPHESAGKKKGTGGAKIGNAHLKWAFSEMAVSFLRHNPPGKQLVERLAQKHGKGKALSILAHKLARAIYYMLKDGVPFNRDKFLATV